MAPRSVDSEARRIEIADAACKVILQKGVEGLRLKEIAAEIGFTTGVIQHYFRNKEALLLFTKTRLVDEKFSRMRSAALREKGKLRLYAMALELLPLTERDVEMYKVLSAFRGRAIGKPALMDLQRRRERMGWDMFAQETVALQATGELPPGLDAERAAIGLVAFIEGLALPLVMGSRIPDHETLLLLCNEYFEATFGPLPRQAASTVSHRAARVPADNRGVRRRDGKIYGTTVNVRRD